MSPRVRGAFLLGFPQVALRAAKRSKEKRDRIIDWDAERCAVFTAGYR